MATAAVLGASGYAGGELVRLLDGHPDIELTHIGGHASEGRRLGELHPQLVGGDRRLGPIDLDRLPKVEIVFLALPHGASALLAAAAAERGMTVIDLGSDMRLDTPERYHSAYGAEHPIPAELGQWDYGLPEVSAKPQPGAIRVAVPGCYPTAAVLAIAPLMAAGIAADTGMVVGCCIRCDRGRAGAADRPAVWRGCRRGAAIWLGGTPSPPRDGDGAGGGRRATGQPELHPASRPDPARPCGHCHRHHEPAAAATGDILETLDAFYRGRRFVEVIDRPPQTRWVSGSNRAMVTAAVDEHAGTVIAVAAIDNLLKGAAGQAVQCANLALGLDEGAGLPVAGWMA